MNLRKVLAVIGLCAIALMVIGAITPDTYAQNETHNTKDSAAAKSADKKSATKSGVSGSLADGSEKPVVGDGDGPKRWQIYLGLGSIPVAWIVIKWL